jgi:hypothetical protein
MPVSLRSWFLFSSFWVLFILSIINVVFWYRRKEDLI